MPPQSKTDQTMDMILPYVNSPVSYSHVYVRNARYREGAADMRRKAILHFLLFHRVPCLPNLVGFDDDRKTHSKGYLLYIQMYLDKVCNVSGRFYDAKTQAFSRRTTQGRMFGVPELLPSIPLHPGLVGYARTWVELWNLLVHEPALTTVYPLPVDDGQVVPIPELDGFDFDQFISDVFGAPIGDARPRKEFKAVTPGDIDRIRQWDDKKRLADMVPELDYVISVLKGMRAEFQNEKHIPGRLPFFKHGKKGTFAQKMKELTYFREEAGVSRLKLHWYANKLVLTANAFRSNLNNGNITVDGRGKLTNNARTSRDCGTTTLV